MRKIKKYKIGIDSETFAISLVEEPAIESDFVALKKEEERKPIQMASEERHMIYGAALIPDMDIYRYDGENEYYINFTRESIEKMAHEFIMDYHQNDVTIDHETNAKDITLVESWLVEDPYMDKANALGITVPAGTWMIAMKVNEIDTWERIKNKELNGFSVESLISLEEFNNQNKDTNNMDKIETNEMFWSKLKKTFKEVLGLASEEEVENEVIETEMEENEPTPEPVLEPEPVAEPTPEPEPVVEPEPEPVVEPVAEPAPEPQDNHLEELINNLRAEIEALKEANNGLQEQVKELGKRPSANPINTNAKPSTGDTYQQWRETMRGLIG